MTNSRIIKTCGTILINKKVESVFNFFGNPSNDNLWRKEINKSTIHGTLQLGVTISEYSYLSKKAPNNLIELICVQYVKNKVALFETPNSAQFYIKSQRQTKAITVNTTEIIYNIDFDTDIVKFALGFALPKFIVSFKAKSDIKKYLIQLKKQLENSNNNETIIQNT